MSISNKPVAVHNTAQGHTSQLEEIDLLPIQHSNRVAGIRQTNKGDVLITPILLKAHRCIGSHGQDLDAAALEFIIIITQARQLRAAVRSHETAQKRQYNWRAAKIRQAHFVTLHILQLEIRRRVPRCDQDTHCSICPSQNISESTAS